MFCCDQGGWHELVVAELPIRLYHLMKFRSSLTSIFSLDDLSHLPTQVNELMVLICSLLLVFTVLASVLTFVN